MSFYDGSKNYFNKIKTFVSGEITKAKTELEAKIAGEYMKKDNTYTKASLYTKTEIDKKIGDLQSEINALKTK